MMTIREIESGSDIMEVNRLAGLIWHEAYRGIVSREQIAYMIERFQSVRAITEQLALEGYRYFLMEDEGRAVGAYRRAGFREVRAQVTDIGGGYVMDDYVMELETTPQKE